MFVRDAVIVAAVAPAAAAVAITPLALLALAGFGGSWLARPKQEHTTLALKLASPFSVGAAVRFGAVFLVITVLSNAAIQLFGPSGFYAVSFLGGFVSSGSAAATAATLASQGKITSGMAMIGVLLACLSSGLLNTSLVWRYSGSALLTRGVLIAVCAFAGLGLVGALAAARLFPGAF
jgi:uncharacterized membrane protein (DUF4010 family)